MSVNLQNWLKGIIATGLICVGYATADAQVPAGPLPAPVAPLARDPIFLAQEGARLPANASQPQAGQPRAAQPEPQRDGIRGVREQDEAARRTADQLNRDARQDARARLDAASTTQPEAIASVGLRGADLGLWFGSGQASTGLTIADVANQGPFFQAGLREGDRVLSINGQPVTSETQFLQLLTSPSLANQTASITVARGNQQESFAIQTSGLMQGVAAADPFFTSGLTIDESNPNRLVVQRVFPRTPAFYAGLRAGDVFTSVNGQPIAGIDALSQALQSGNGESLGLVVTRNGQPRQLSLGIDDGVARTALRPNFGAAGVQAGANTTNQIDQSGLNSTGGITPSTSTIPPTTIPGNTAGNALPPSAIRPLPGTSPVPGVPGAAPGRPTITPSQPSQGSVNPGIRGGANVPGGAGTVGGSGATAGGRGAVGGTGASVGGSGSTAGGAGVTGGTGAARGGTGSTAGGAGATGGTGAAGAVGGASSAGAGGAGTGGAGAGAGGSGGAGGGT